MRPHHQALNERRKAERAAAPKVATSEPLMTYEQIAAVLGCSKSRVEQLERSGLAKLRKRMGSRWQWL